MHWLGFFVGDDLFAVSGVLLFGLKGGCDVGVRFLFREHGEAQLIVTNKKAPAGLTGRGFLSSVCVAIDLLHQFLSACKPQ